MPQTLTIIGETARKIAKGTKLASWLDSQSGGIRLPPPTNPEGIDSAIVTILNSLQTQDLTYIGPGAPTIDDPLVMPLKQAALDMGCLVTSEEGIPFWFGGIDATEGFSVRRPDDVLNADMSIPLVITGLMQKRAIHETASAVFARSARPQMTLIGATGTYTDITQPSLRSLDIDTKHAPFALTVGAIAPTDDLNKIESLLWIVRRLCASDGCPWDRVQTHRSLRKYLPEEAFEAVAAINDNDSNHLTEELGDLLLQIALHARIAEAAGAFRFSDVVASVAQKMIRRHPHVFGSPEAKTVSEVLETWEAIKANERGLEESGLESISSSLPSLTYARELIARALQYHIDFRPSDIEKSMQSLTHTIRNCKDTDSKYALMGELLLHLVEISARINIDPEFALRQALMQRLSEQSRS